MTIRDPNLTPTFRANFARFVRWLALSFVSVAVFIGVSSGFDSRWMGIVAGTAALLVAAVVIIRLLVPWLAASINRRAGLAVAGEMAPAQAISTTKADEKHPSWQLFLAAILLSIRGQMLLTTLLIIAIATPAALLSGNTIMVFGTAAVLGLGGIAGYLWIWMTARVTLEAWGWHW